MESLLSDAPAPVCAGDGLRIFAYADSMVRTVDVGGEPWFVAKDVALILGYDIAPHMTRNLDEDEVSSIQIVDRTSDKGGNPNMTIISESGLYHAIFQSRKEEAKAFRRWVTGEVLPAIRRTGGYDAAPRAADAAVFKEIRMMVGKFDKLMREGKLGDSEFVPMMNSVLDGAGFPIKEHLALYAAGGRKKRKPESETIRRFFAERVRIVGGCEAWVTSSALHEAFVAWSGVSLPQRAFTALVKGEYPRLEYAQKRCDGEKPLQWGFFGIEMKGGEK